MTDPFPTTGIPFFRGLRVGVTGATGLIGSYAVKVLHESGAHVKAIYHKRPPNEFAALADTMVFHNLANPNDARAAVYDCEIVVGCAGITGGVNLPKLDPVSYVGPATAMVINTLQACVDEKITRFGFLSSTTVYPPSERPMREEDADSDTPLYPLYRGIGMSKLFLERLCRYYHETTGIGVGIVRPSGAYGRFDNFEEETSHVLPGLVSRVLRHEADQPFEIWGDGGDVRDFIHAQDVARALLLAVAGKADAVPYNAASGTPVTTGELARRVLDAAKVVATMTCRTDKPSAMRTRLVDVSQAERDLGFVAEVSLDDGIRDVVAWRRAR